MLRTLLFTLALLLACSVRAEETPAAPPTAASLAEPPHWSFGVRLPDDLVGQRNAKAGMRGDVLVWVPEGAKRIRAMLIIPENSDSKHFGEHAPFRKVAAAHEMGVIYLRGMVKTGIESEKEAPDTKNIPAILGHIADAVGIPEIRHAPWIAFGKSSRGKFPIRMAWMWPDRTIATVTYHGETPTWPVAEWANVKDQTILHVNANGETEWGGTWFVHVRPSLLNYRAKKKYLPHIAVAKDVGHGDYVDGHGSPGWGKEFPGQATCIRVWDYLTVFVDKALTLRLPKDKYATDGPIELQKVDESQGYLIDPFAIEDAFGVPHLPLKEGPDGFQPGGSAESPVDGFAAFAPKPDFVIPEGVPVAKYESAMSPKEWIITDSVKFPMKADPMVELGAFQTLNPKPGDKVQIDSETVAFRPIKPKEVAEKGGIALNTGLRPPNAKITLLAYTVLDVPEKKTVRVRAGYTAATRVQLVLQGVPIRHKQVLELQPGKYPLLVVLRMTANWERIEPGFEDAGEDVVAQARAMQKELDERAAELAKIRASAVKPKPRVVKASEVPEAERARMFWVADQEQAEAWLQLHLRSWPEKAK